MASGFFAHSLVERAPRHSGLSPGDEHGRAGCRRIPGRRSGTAVARRTARIAEPRSSFCYAGRAKVHRTAAPERRQRQRRLGYTIGIAIPASAGAIYVAGAYEY